MKTSDFWYDLPQELIAQEPLIKRDMSKLMVVDKESGEIQHKIFNNIVNYINKGDTLVLNNTRVIPARIFGSKIGTGGKIEMLLLKNLGNNTWEVLTKPGKKALPGTIFEFGEGKLEAEVLSIAEDGNRIVRFMFDGVFEEILDEIGLMPLPHYITKHLEDKERYQTVFARINGSAAAPTAGLHFTPEIFQKLKRKGVNICYVTLHVGLGTFRPVKVENVLEHKMHSEYFAIDANTCDLINTTKANGNKVFAVGTTSCRTLESAVSKDGLLVPQSRETDIFIYPGYKFKMVDSLITNFHLPESTLIMLISAFTNKQIIMNAYQIAVKEKYRFFSFGDAMLII